MAVTARPALGGRGIDVDGDDVDGLLGLRLGEADGRRRAGPLGLGLRHGLDLKAWLWLWARRAGYAGDAGARLVQVWVWAAEVEAFAVVASFWWLTLATGSET